MGWRRGLPTSAEIGFTYFSDLKKPTHNSNLNERKEALAAEVDSLMRSIGPIESGSKSVQEALDFIHTIAESERKKELEILQNYKNHLKQNLPPNKELDELIEKLDSPETIDKDFYRKLTKAINMIRQDANDFKNKLNRFASHNKQEMNELAKDDFRFRIVDSLQANLNSLMGTATAAQKSADESYAGKLRELIIDQLMRENIINCIGGGVDLAALLAGVQVSLEATIQKENYKDSKFKDVADLSKATLQEIIDTYNDEHNAQLTRVQRALNGDVDELQALIEEGKKFLTFSKVDDPKILRQRINRIKKTNRNTELDTIGKRLAANDKYKKILEEYMTLDVQVKTSINEKNPHGRLYEFIASVLRDGSMKVRGSSAIDLVTIECLFKNPDQRNRARELQTMITDAYSRYARLQSASDKERNEELINEMNQTILRAEAELNQMLGGLNNVEDIFIYHESLKLYMTMETNKAEKGFHGRNMAILSAITEIYNAAGLGDFVLPNRKAIEMIAYNLAPETLGQGYKGDIEYIFSIFAGLLMFGDIQNIALEAAKQVDTGSVKNIHMYLLNGVYVPASLLLESTYQAATEAVSELSLGKDTAAKAKVALNGAGTPVANWLATRPGSTPEIWAGVAKEVISEIKIQISFMSGFVNFVNSLIS